MEGSYNYLVHNNKFISGKYDRSFDLNPNGVTLQQAALFILFQPTQGWGGLVNVILGRDALTVAPFGYNPAIDIDHIGFVPLQAYAQYADGKLTVFGGNFNSLIGIENTDPTINTNFSESLLATFTQPNTHLGTRIAYALNDVLKFTVGFNNGWDNIRDFHRDKTLELSLAYTSPKWVFSLAGLSGEERGIDKTATGPRGRRNLIDIFATYNITDHYNISFNYDYGQQYQSFLSNGRYGTAMWQGLAAYFNYKFNDKWRFAIRAEDFSDNKGARTGVAQNLKEATLTVGYNLTPHFALAAEIRHDISNVASFMNKNGTHRSKAQQSCALQLLYHFAGP